MNTYSNHYEPKLFYMSLGWGGYKVFLTLLQNTHQCKQWSFMPMIPFLFHLFSGRAYCSEAVYQTWNKSDAIDEIQRPTVAIPDLSYVNNLGDDKTIWSVIIDHFIHSFIWRVRYSVFCLRGATDVLANHLPLPQKITDNDGNSTIRNNTWPVLFLSRSHLKCHKEEFDAQLVYSNDLTRKQNGNLTMSTCLFCQGVSLSGTTSTYLQ